MKQVNSPDIQVLDYDVLMDISTATPSITFTNQSVASNPANLDWVFKITSPLGSVIYEGSFSAPDVDGAWAVPFVRNTGFPRPYGQIEWSGNPYRVTVYVRDSENDIHEYSKSIKVCRPSGNTQNSKDTYGKGFPKLVSSCSVAKLWVEDKTQYTYSGYNGSMVSKLFRLVHPMDDSGNRPPNTELTDFNSGLLSVYQSGDGYEYFFVAVYDYDQGNRVTVRVKYLDRDRFAVRCNIDLSPIACELQKLSEKFEKGNCRDAAEAQRTIDLVSAKLHIATIAILHPQANIDPYKIVDEINQLTGWDCNCCPGGINAQGAMIDDLGIAYDVIEEGGDIEGTISIVDSTVQIRLKDFTYVSRVDAGSTSNALSITPSVVGRTKYFDFKIDRATLTDEILTQFETNTTFINRLTSLLSTNITSGNMRVNVNKRCLNIGGQAGEAFNYNFTTRALAVGETVFIKTFKFQDSVSYVNFLFDGTNAAALEAALNAVGKGVFTVVFGVDRVLHLNSNGNPFDILDVAVHYSGEAGNVDHSLTMTKLKTTTTLFAVQDVLQGIIDFVCQSITSNINTGIGLSILQLQAIGGAINTINIQSSDPITKFFTDFTNAYNRLVQIVQAIKPASCETIGELFNTADTDGLEDTDQFMMRINNTCRTVTPRFVASKVLDLATKDQTVKDLLCKAVAACTKAICAAVTNATATYNPGTQVLSTVITNNGASKYRVGYRTVTDGRAMFLGVDIVDAVAGATTPHSWNGVPAGQWEIMVVAVCADGSESSPYYVQSEACTPPASLNVVEDGGNFKVSFGAVTAANVRLTINYPNGSQQILTYASNVAQPITIAKPAGVYGQFTFRLQAVCDAATGWYSAYTAPVNINVAEPSKCPSVVSAIIFDIIPNGVKVTATKPTGANIPVAYTLILTPQGGVAKKYTKNQVGAYVEWDITDLANSTEYAVEIQSQCTTGVGDLYYAGRFATPFDNTANSYVKNNSIASTAESVSVLINNVLHHYVAPHPFQNQSNFQVSGNQNAEVKVVICNLENNVLDVTITNGLVVFNPTDISPDGQTYTFSNVDIKGAGIGINYIAAE